MGNKIVIIGGAALGPKTAARVRRRDPDAEITIIERNDVYSYASCGTPFYIEGLIQDHKTLLRNNLGQIRDETFFKSQKDVKIYGRTEAIKINRAWRTVTVKDLDKGWIYDIPYNKLVLGMGASPVQPSIEGINLKGVHRLHTISDAISIKNAVNDGAEKIVIVGAGLIGMELCGAFPKASSITIIEMMNFVMPNLLDPEFSLLLQNYLKTKNIQVILGTKVQKILGKDGKVIGLETSNGVSYPADLIIIAVGVRPNTSLATEAGLDIGVTKAIKVNEFMQTNDPDIYAGGDCVENTHLLINKKVYIPLGSTANKHGRVIGDNITGGSTKFPGILGTTVFKVAEFNAGKTGLSEEEAKKEGFTPVSAIAPRTDISDYYPGAKMFILKLIADKASKKILGAQVIGAGEGIKRLDVIATILSCSGTVDDVANLDLGYAPPYSTAIDAVIHAANIIRNKIEGLANGITANELWQKIQSMDDFIILDVRTVSEIKNQPFIDNRLQHIPLEELRYRLREVNKNKEIFTICKTSVRAYEAERILRGAGYNKVKFLDGSLTAWPYQIN
ncbi:pyridine nucleotide-disulfide oxidoreductase [Candidatus Bathyarchaeota archaeon]|nr:pyridine nucleotide-disulfide oxidoreductase [Candidatus Bathyarchaeota archaeon]